MKKYLMLTDFTCKSSKEWGYDEFEAKDDVEAMFYMKENMKELTWCVTLLKKEGRTKKEYGCPTATYVPTGIMIYSNGSVAKEDLSRPYAIKATYYQNIPTDYTWC